MPSRRRFFAALTSLPFIGGLFGETGSSGGRAPARDFFKELGVRRFINAAGTYTALTGSLMPPEVLAAFAYASRHYVPLDELHDKVGEQIARLLQCEAAMVTAGAASALTLGTAGVLTGNDSDNIRRLPDLTEMRSEVIIQKSHRFGYEHAVRNCGIRFVEVESREELERSINDRTAMMLFLNAANNAGPIRDIEFAQLGRRHRVRTFNDCAADVPPMDNLFKYIRMGFDLVTFSGGKGIRAPQSTGLLFGRKDLIEAARLNTCPHADTIGRGMKVNKEEMLAMLVALELYLKKDHEGEWAEWEQRVRTIRERVARVPGVQSEVYVPEIANHTPHVRVSWDRDKIRRTPSEIKEALKRGEPSIEVMSGQEGLMVAVWMMEPGEESVVAQRLFEVLRGSN